MRPLLIFVAMMWLAVQSMAAAHGVDAGTTPEHDEHHCILCLSQDRGDDGAVVPGPAAVTNLPIRSVPALAFARECLDRGFDWIRPPAHGPPVS